MMQPEIDLISKSDLPAAVSSNTAFALDLYRQLASRPGNLFLSPYNISIAMAMTYAGARGETERQIAAALHFDLHHERLHPAFTALRSRLKTIQDRGDVQIHEANSLWPQAGYPFLDDYLALIERQYATRITPVDYRNATEAARQLINQWAEDKTENKIRELIKPGLLDSLTRLVLASAIYFKGDWQDQFNEARTFDAEFWLTPSKSVQASMMHRTGMYGYAQLGDLQVLEMPYSIHDLSMLILLPKEISGLGKIEHGLNPGNLDGWIGSCHWMEVEVHLPRYSIRSEFRLADLLEGLGMVDAFDPSKANFVGMDGREKALFISEVIHQAFVDVNEQGTEAAAATAVWASFGGMPEPPIIFRADHPFVFLIRDNKLGSILFIGRVVNPV